MKEFKYTIDGKEYKVEIGEINEDTYTAKVKVNGEDADRLFKFLQEQKGDITWNFTKYLTNKRGQVVARFEPADSIESIAGQIETLLEQ